MRKIFSFISLFMALLLVIISLSGCKANKIVETKKNKYTTEYIRKEIPYDDGEEYDYEYVYEESDREEDSLEMGENNAGKTYYCSISGNDWNDGTSPDNPVQTLAIASSIAKTGDTVLFKCGDVWRNEKLITVSGVKYGNYGSGNQPAFYGSAKNYSGKGLWEKTDRSNIWVCTEEIKDDVGTIFFNNVEATGYKKMKSIDELENDLDFYHDFNKNQVFLYSEINPSERYKDIEFSIRSTLISGKSNVTIDGITMQFADYGIVSTGDTENFTVKNCNFKYLGGCRHSTVDEIRYGNAIEIYGSCDNILIENNYMSQIYDTGFTCQMAGTPQSDVIMRNITVKNNKIEYCYWSMEYYMTTSRNPNITGYLGNLTITGNTFAHAGEGWSGRQRNKDSAAHIQTFTWDGFKKENIKITKNVFDCSVAYLMYFGWEDYVPEFKGNTYVQYKGSQFGFLKRKPYSFTDSIMTMITTFDSEATIKFA